jgi:hypothetical protein
MTKLNKIKSTMRFVPINLKQIVKVRQKVLEVGGMSLQAATSPSVIQVKEIREA